MFKLVTKSGIKFYNSTEIRLIEKPNGKYCTACRDGILYDNLSRDEVIDIFVKKTIDEVNSALNHPSSIAYLIENGLLSAADIIKLNADVVNGLSEPKLVLNRHQIEPLVSTCTTGQCPNCNTTVMLHSGLSVSNNNCPNCGQLLSWNNE